MAPPRRGWCRPPAARALGVSGIVLALLGALAEPKRVEGQGIPPVRVVVLPPCQAAGQAVEVDVSTGLNISPGQQDMYWQLASVPPNQTGVFPSYATIPYSSWVPATPPANWIHRIQGFTPQSDSAGSYIYRLQFNLNPAFYSSIQIVGNYAADNSVFVQLNGVPMTYCPGNVCFQALHPFSITSGFVNGLNYLDIIVNNDSGPSPTGLLVEAKIQATCRTCAWAPSGMVAWWPLNETSGTTVADIVGGNNGTPKTGPIGSGGPTPGSGKVVGALNFNGTSDSVQVPNGPNLNFGTGSLSIDAWIKIPGSGAGFMPIVDKEIPGPTDAPYGYVFYVKDGHLGFAMSNDVNVTPHAGIGAEDLATNLADNLWHHVAVTVQRNPASATGGNLFIDGVAIATATFSTTPFVNLTADNAGDLVLGSRNRLGRLPVSDFFNGPIDEVEIFHRALNPSEIQDIFNAGPVGKCIPTCVQPPSGMVAWYPLDEQSGATVVHDIWTNQLNGTPVPGPIGFPGPGSITGHVNTSFYGFSVSYVAVPSSSHLNFFQSGGTGEFSIDAWVKISSAICCGQGAIDPVVDKTFVSGSSVTGYALYLYTAGQGTHLALTLDDGMPVTSPTLSDPTPLPADRNWHHVAVTVARPNPGSADVALYVDGAPWNAATIPVGNTDNIADLWIGHSRVGSLVGTGDGAEYAIDEVEIFNGVLTPQDILAIYHADTAGKCRPASRPAPPSIRHLPFR